jgi:hypothetical protein
MSIKKTMEAYLEMVSEAKKLDPVDDKANDKKFKDRKDKDIDNDGDVDSSDEFLHKRRKAIDNKKDGGEKPADNKDKEEGNKFTKALNAAKKKGDDEFVVAGKKYSVKEEEGDEEESDEPKKKKPFPPKKDGEEEDSEAEKDEKEEDPVDADGEDEKPEDKKKKKSSANSGEKTAEISKIGEGTHQGISMEAATAELLDAVQQMFNEKRSAGPIAGAPPEKIDDKESKSGKDFIAKHKVDVKTHDELEKIEEPKERKVKKEMTEFEVIRAILSGKTPE